MELCKTETNMSLEMNGTGLSQQGEPLVMPLVPTGLAQGEVVMPPPASAMDSNGHLKCTCLPSIAPSEIDIEKMKDIVEAEAASMALAEVSTASHNSKVTFNDEIQVVRDEEGEEQVVVEDDMIDLAEALYAAGVRPELLASISEEDIFRPEDVMSDEDLASGIHDVDAEELGLMWSEYEPPMQEVILTNDRLRGLPKVTFLTEAEAEAEGDKNYHRLPPTSQGPAPRLFASLSEPDLLSIKLPHPSSRPVFGLDPDHLPVKRQKTWQAFNKPIIRNILKILPPSLPPPPVVAVAETVTIAATAAANIQETEEVASNGEEEATSFV